MFMVFGGSCYYPDRGVGGLVAMEENRDVAIQIGKDYLERNKSLCWAQVFDVDARSIIWQWVCYDSYDQVEDHTIVDMEYKRTRD